MLLTGGKSAVHWLLLLTMMLLLTIMKSDTYIVLDLRCDNWKGASVILEPQGYHHFALGIKRNSFQSGEKCLLPFMWPL